MKNNIYQKVTDLIISKLEKNIIPWRKTWDSFAPLNFQSKKSYRGINFIVLGNSDFPSPYFITFKQCSLKHGKILKGSKGLPVVFWKFFDVLDDDVNQTEIQTAEKHVPFISQSTVFNLAQTDLYNPENTIELERPTAETFINQLNHIPEIRNNFTHSSYYPGQDYISIPPINQFETPDGYYAALFHELIHSTGHKSKLNRFDDDNYSKDDYSFEELTAEIGSAFLCSKCGISNTLDNSTAYIKGWLSKLNNDNKLVIRASSKAQKAVSYLLNKAVISNAA